MRTTVTLDPDVAAKLKQTARESDITFKEAVNSTLRRGFELSVVERGKPYRLPPGQRLEPRPGVNLDKALQLAGEMEDAETIRKLRLGK
jgi:hypothetical protein